MPRLPALIILAILAGCHRGRSGVEVTPTVPVFTGAVTIAANDNSWVPLVGIVSLTTDVPTRVELRITEGTRRWQVIADARYRTDHPRVPVAGLRPGRSHSIEVLVRDELGNLARAANVLEFTPPQLPANFPPIAVSNSIPQYMENQVDGVTLLSLLASVPGSLPTLIDAAGNVVWYFDVSQTPLADDQVMAFPLANGNLMLVGATQVMVEVDLLGDTVRTFWASGLMPSAPGLIAVDTDSFHHDLVEMPAGSGADFAVLGTELRTLPNYPASVVNPSQTVPSADVIGDEIVEFRADGTIVRRFRLLDLLDPYRVVYDSLNDFWDEHYGIPTVDWSHANGIALDPQSDSWIVSLRHQDIVVQIGRSSGEVEWILGDPARWNAPWSSKLLTPVGGNFAWQYHQHAPQLLPDGSLMLFDNGNHRAIPPLPPMPFPESYSRAVQYRVDAGLGTVEQLWAYGGPPNTASPSFFSFFVSSAYRQPQSGNVLVCDGGKMEGGGSIYAHLFEVTTEPLPQVVFECEIRADGVANTESYFIYRAYRLPGVYR